jgi:predicted secreted protein
MAKYAAFGIALKKGGTAYANVTNISGPNLSVDVEDVTSHDSTGAWEEVVATIIRSGEITMDIVYDPAHATHKYAAGGLLYDLVQRTAIEFTLVFPDDASTTWTFNALITGFEPTGPVGGELGATVKFKVTGQPTLV